MNDYASDTGANKAECHRLAPFLGMLLDGELDKEKTIEVEEHVASCEACSEQLALKQAIVGSLRRTTKSETALSGDARERMMAAMAVAKKAADAEARTQREGAKAAPGLLSFRVALPLASAAAFAVLWQFGTRHGQASHVATDDMQAARAAVADPLADLVAEHSRPLPPERTDPKEVRALEKYVGVPIRPPHKLERAGARFMGGRVLTMQHERAAMLQYEMGQGASAQRVSVFIYDPRKIQVSGPALAARSVGTADVLAGQQEGYSVAVTQRGGVGYVLASDMDPEANVRLAAMTGEDD
jgi:anti-sigma factor RsiW